MNDGLRWEKWTDGRYQGINWGAKNRIVICQNCQILNCNNCNCNEQGLCNVNNFRNKQTDPCKNCMYLTIRGL